MKLEMNYYDGKIIVDFMKIHFAFLTLTKLMDFSYVLRIQTIFDFQNENVS